jgi:hypothetical protein
LNIGTPYPDKEHSSSPNLDLKVSRTLGRTLESSFPEELVWFSSLAKHHSKKAFVVPQTSYICNNKSAAGYDIVISKSSNYLFRIHVTPNSEHAKTLGNSNAYMSSFTKDRTASHASLSASFERWYTMLSPELVMFAASSLAGTTGRMYWTRLVVKISLFRARVPKLLLSIVVFPPSTCYAR